MRNKNIKVAGIVAGVALLLYSSVLAYRAMYYSERNRIRAYLESISNVEIVNISGDDHLTYFHTKFVDLRLKDHPNSFIGLEAPALGILKESDHVFLSNIGSLILASQVHTSIDGKDQLKCAWGSIDIGPASPVADQLPFTVRKIEDIISHYSQLEAFFAERSEKKPEGESIRRAGNVVTCYLPAGCD